MRQRTILLHTIILLISIIADQQLAARTYYVSTYSSGTGDGSSLNNAAPYTDIQGNYVFLDFLRNYEVIENDEDSRVLNIIFVTGIYDIPWDRCFEFNTADKIKGLEVYISPHPDEDVPLMFDAGTSIRIISLTGGANPQDAMKLTFENVYIGGFSSSGDLETGANSLFTLGDYNTLTLKNINIYNDVYSNRNPLVAMAGSYSSLVVTDSDISAMERRGTGGYPVVETVIGTTNVKMEFRNTTLSGFKTGDNEASSYMFYLENPESSLILDNVIVESNVVGQALIGINNNTSDVTISNSTFRNNNTSVGEGILIHSIDHRQLNISNCSFLANEGLGNSQSLIYLTGLLGTSIIQGSTFSENFGAGVSYICRSSQGNILIYNNTFSSNSMTYAIYGIGASTGAIINNTLSNSRLIRTGSVTVRNNLLLTGYIARFGTDAVIARNIFNGNFYESGIDNGVPIADIANYVSATLTEYEPGRPKVHPLIISSTANPILQKGGPASDTGYGTYLSVDQRGKKRPGLISIGSCDLPDFTLRDRPNYNVIYDPTAGLKSSYRIDFTNYIVTHPEGATPSNSTCEILTQPFNGELIPSGDYFVFDFIPKRDPDDPTQPLYGLTGVPFELSYKVSYELAGVVYAATGELTVTIINSFQPIGLIDDNIIRCSEDVRPVDFTTRYKFISGSYNNRPVDGYEDSFPNSGFEKFYGSSIPLVADLDGDGKSEIVTFGIGDNNDGLSATAYYLYILDGQTGKVIVKYSLPMNWNLKNNGPFSSPANMAIVDSDNNGRGEIIMALGFNRLFPQYSKKLISFEVNENTFYDGDGGMGATNPNKLSLKWNLNAFGTSVICYDAYGDNNMNFNKNYDNFAKPIIQVVDINQDGLPEVIVYNKIYNASTGEYIMKLNDLAETVSASPAFVGQDRLADQGDYDIGFSYIQDVDMDGTYDIAAGGQLYYKINMAEGSYLVRQMSGVGDGHTAVADINSDGIPEIIVSAFENNRNRLKITVWDPGLLRKDGQGKIIADNRTPQIIAERTMPCNPAGKTGNHSYMAIGDIDGKLQNGKKYPEISISGSHFFVTSGLNAIGVPVHPNVTDGALTSGFTYSSNSTGALISLTWDDAAGSVNDRLKVSFVMEHQDNSMNTGFSLFDFDADFTFDICFRDNKELRVISAKKSLVRVNETPSTHPDIIRFSKRVNSYTGFEYPVIADVNGDGSAKIVVMGHNEPEYNDFGYVYVIESTGNRFAPSPAIWNQFMYSPLKISGNLTTPLKTFTPSDFGFYTASDEMETYIYNNTLAQTGIYSAIEKETSPGNITYSIEPIVPIPDAQIINGNVDRYANQLVYSIKNTGDAVLNASTPVCIYRENQIPSGLLISAKLGRDVYPGDSATYTYALSGELVTCPYFTVRVSDASTSTQDLFMQNYPDCNWADNFTEVGDFILRDDYITVSQYKTIMIDILGNDSTPSDCDVKLFASNITTPGGVGDLDGIFGSIMFVGNKLQYTAPGRYENGVVEISYQLTCGNITSSAKAYIYILESCNSNFSACANSSYLVCLETRIPGVTYEWYNDKKEFISNDPIYFTQLTENVAFYVKPEMPEGHPYRLFDFPMGEIMIDVLPIGADMETVKWVGTYDTDWNNPANWIRLKNNVEYPISWVPTNCVNVILTKDAPYYPILNYPAGCANLKLEDRSMLAGIHHLDYQQAQVDLSFSHSELNRFVMWSAPLKATYTGDYHLDRDLPDAKRGDVYMNFFQSKNPDYPSSVATENVFTSTFASLDMVLPLGKAFGIKIYQTDGLKPDFAFPKTATYYRYENQTTTGELNRTGSGRLITDGISPDGKLILPVDGDNNFRMIQVVNPFMAYLKVNDFLVANSSVLEQSYKLWNGDINENFVSIIPPETPDQRLVIDFDQIAGSPQGALIAPLQSFFVIKKPGVNGVTSLNVSGTMTTTLRTDQLGGYVLRNAEKETRMLRMKATQDKYTDMTVIYNCPQSKKEYDSDEDSWKLFNANSRIAVYTLSPSKVPLAINSNGDYSAGIPIGFRLRNDAKVVTLDFSGLSTFGYDVVLTDKLLKQSVDVETNPLYYFSVEKSGSQDIIEVNDRFVLQFTEDVGNEDIEDNDINVFAKEGRIRIRSIREVMKGYEIYNLMGQLVTNGREPAYDYRVNVPFQNFYIVKVLLNDEFTTKKVFVD